MQQESIGRLFLTWGCWESLENIGQTIIGHLVSLSLAPPGRDQVPALPDLAPCIATWQGPQWGHEDRSRLSSRSGRWRLALPTFAGSSPDEEDAP